MGWVPLGSEGTKNGVPGYMQPKPCVVCPGLDVAGGFGAGWGFAAGWSFAVGWDFTEALEFVVGVEKAQGDAWHPC